MRCFSLEYFLSRRRLRKPPRNCDGIEIIVPIGYGSFPDRLALGTVFSLRKAAYWARVFPEAAVVFTSSFHLFSGSEIVERRLKHQLLFFLGIGADRIREGRPIKNSVTEAYRTAETFTNNPQKYTGSILLVAGATHSHSVYMIWRKILPKAKLFITSFSPRVEHEKQHPALLQRNLYFWFATSLLRSLLVACLGLSFTAKIQHFTLRSHTRPDS